MNDPGEDRRDLLARLLEERRLDIHRAGLPSRWADIAAASGVSVEVIRALRNDRADVRDTTLADIEHGMHLAPGSIRAVMDGHADTLTTTGLPAPRRGGGLASWVAGQMSARGTAPSAIVEFAGRMGWRGAGAPPAEDLTLRQWGQIGAELGMSAEEAIRAYRESATNGGTPGRDGLDGTATTG